MDNDAIAERFAVKSKYFLHSKFFFDSIRPMLIGNDGKQDGRGADNKNPADVADTKSAARTRPT